MSVRDMEVGKEVWFISKKPDEKGRLRSFGGYGRVQEIMDDGKAKKAVLDGMGGTEGQYTAYKFQCYDDQLDMKMDLGVEKLMDVMTDVSQKYMDTCKTLLHLEEQAVMSQMPSGSELFLENIKLKMQIAGGQFKEQVMGVVDDFVKGTQKDSLARMSQDTKELAFHTDLSQYDPGWKLDLTDEDIVGIGLDDPEVTLTAEDLDFGNGNEPDL